MGGLLCLRIRDPLFKFSKPDSPPSLWCLQDLAADGVGRVLVLEEVVKVAADPAVLGMRGIDKGGVGGGQLLVGNLLKVRGVAEIKMRLCLVGESFCS
jgi:hypothetical protein